MLFFSHSLLLISHNHPFLLPHTFFQNVSVSHLLIKSWNHEVWPICPLNGPWSFFHKNKKNTMFPPHNIHVCLSALLFTLISSSLLLFFLLAVKKDLLQLWHSDECHGSRYSSLHGNYFINHCFERISTGWSRYSSGHFTFKAS